MTWCDHDSIPLFTMSQVQEMLSSHDVQGQRETNATFEKDRIRVRVLDGNSEYGEFADGEHMVFLEFKQGAHWKPILFIHEEHLWKIRVVLEQVQDYLE